MRKPFLMLCLLLATPVEARSGLTPEACAEKADAVTALMRSTLNSANRVSAVEHQSLAAAAPGRLGDAAERAEIARQELLVAMREYADAADALAYQLQTCAR